MVVEKLIAILRSMVNVQNASVQDTAYLSLSDEDIKLYIEIIATRDFPKMSLDSIPTECVYPLVLLAKKELYFALASKDAVLYDLTADNNNQLKKSQRFEHYMKLIAITDSEYNQYVEDGGTGQNTLTSYDVLLSSRFYTKRNYELGEVPVLSVSVDSFTSTTVDISWEVVLSRFLCTRVYVSTSPIYDSHADNVIANGVEPVLVSLDAKKKQCRISGLLPNTLYHILVSVQDRTTNTGYEEVTITTASV
jgi:hypothetical protein